MGSMATTKEIDRQTNDDLLHAQGHVWNHIFNFSNSMCLNCAVQLGIPDIIHKHGKPMPLSTLIDSLPINKAKALCIPRLMRILIHYGFLVKSKLTKSSRSEEETVDDDDDEEEEEEGYSLAPASFLLLKDGPFSMVPFLSAVFRNPVLMDPFFHMSKWFQTADDRTSFETAHGMTFWDYLGQEPLINSYFHEAMASDARLVSSVILGSYKQVFEGLSSVVDVGGGTGILAKEVAKAFPEMECIVLDLLHVVEGLEGSNNLKFVGGDMFESIPVADAVLLKSILHNWNDEDSIKILKKCKEAVLPSKEKGGRVIIVDMVLNRQKAAGGDDHGDESSSMVESQLFFDMLMMVLVDGKEREEKQWAKLFSDSGFIRYKITHILGSRSLIEVYP